MTVTLIDPTLAPAGGGRALAARLNTLDGAVLGLVTTARPAAARSSSG